MIRKLLKSVREYKTASIKAPLYVSLEVVMEVIIPLLMAALTDAVSVSASPSADFEPRYLTWAVSDGECPARGACIIIY